AARTRQLRRGGVRGVAQTSVGAGRADQFGGAVGGSAGRVSLVRVVQFDDLRRLEVGGRLRRKVHHEYGGDPEVGGDEHVDARLRVQHAADFGESGVVEPGGAHHGVDPVLDEPAQVVHHRIGVGEIDDHVGAEHLAAVVPDVDSGYQFGVVGRFHGLDDF